MITTRYPPTPRHTLFCTSVYPYPNRRACRQRGGEGEVGESRARTRAGTAGALPTGPGAPGLLLAHRVDLLVRPRLDVDPRGRALQQAGDVVYLGRGRAGAARKRLPKCPSCLKAEQSDITNLQIADLTVIESGVRKAAIDVFPRTC